jgi:hypothetical protein
VKEPSDVTRLLEQGMKVRQVAATQMNERSSRSHSCFTIKISSKTTIQQQQLQQSEGDGGIICQKETNMTSKINLVDLAGSERASKTGATGERLKEGAAINKSLSALGNVINMLADHKSNVKKQQHVPYRDSKLTRLLQESLGGNALTCMIAAISPADDNYEESLSTLQYANRAKSIKNVTKKNEDINEKIIRELRQEIEKLRQLVESGGNDEVQQQKQQQAIIDDDDQQQQQQQYHHHQEAMQQMEETIANLERIKQESWEEKKRLTELYEQERQKSLTNDQQIFTLMQTVQEEKKHIFKEIKILQLQKNTLFKEMKITKEKYQKEKDKLQQIMLIYQQQENNGEKSIDILQEMDETKSKIIEKRHFMLDLKEQITQIEKLILEEEAAFQAKTFLLQENEQLRKVSFKKLFLTYEKKKNK